MKSIKKCLSYLIAFSLLYGLSMPVSAVSLKYPQYVLSAVSEVSSIYEKQLSIKKVEDLNGFDNKNTYCIATFKSGGFVIIDKNTEDIVEASLSNPSPFEKATGKKYYGGPLNYAYKLNNNLYECKTKSLISSSKISSINSKIKNIENTRQEENKTLNYTSMSAIPSGCTIVSYANYIQNTLSFGNNTNGTCGSVAAGMMLTCLDKYVYGVGKIVPLQMPYGETLHQSLIPYCEMSTGGSTPSSICIGIKNWMYNNVIFGYTPKYVYAIHDPFVKSNINNNKTCVVALSNLLGSPFGDHMVMVYGYKDSLYLAHVGWHEDNYSAYLINSNYSVGACWIE